MTSTKNLSTKIDRTPPPVRDGARQWRNFVLWVWRGPKCDTCGERHRHTLPAQAMCFARWLRNKRLAEARHA